MIIFIFIYPGTKILRRIFIYKKIKEYIILISSVANITLNLFSFDIVSHIQSNLHTIFSQIFMKFKCNNKIMFSPNLILTERLILKELNKPILF